VGEVLVDGVALRLADALQDHLFGGLGGDAPKLLGRVWHAHDVAHIGGGHVAPCVLFRDLGAFADHIVDHFPLGKHAHFAGVAVHFRGDICHRAKIAFIGRNQRCLNRLKDDLAVKPFVDGHLIDAGN
jgi:hypothetical protein